MMGYFKPLLVFSSGSHRSNLENCKDLFRRTIYGHTPLQLFDKIFENEYPNSTFFNTTYSYLSTTNPILGRCWRCSPCGVSDRIRLDWGCRLSISEALVNMLPSAPIVEPGKKFFWFLDDTIGAAVSLKESPEIDIFIAQVNTETIYEFGIDHPPPMAVLSV